MPGREEAPRELLGTTGPPGPGRTKRRAPGPGPRSRPGQWRRIPRHQGDRSSRAAKPPNQRLSSCLGSSWPRPSCLLAPDWLTAFPLGWDWRLAGGTPPRTGGGCRERAAGARAGRLPSGHAGIVIGGANPPVDYVGVPREAAEDGVGAGPAQAPHHRGGRHRRFQR